uniref:Uncharacterized protein n=1 Tax=Scleropages formosus TaxID=113540 RepID=A0A8C9T4E0_SCLFO
LGYRAVSHDSVFVPEGPNGAESMSQENVSDRVRSLQVGCARARAHTRAHTHTEHQESMTPCTVAVIDEYGYLCTACLSAMYTAGWRRFAQRRERSPRYT